MGDGHNQYITKVLGVGKEARLESSRDEVGMLSPTPPSKCVCVCVYVWDPCVGLGIRGDQK